ncbi:MAG: hypothetical protein M1829_002008 [Trizodia sp. TS-e1964]|nr:MAG: hypothetical protein M1829_002008 [Trizodia sp. TS-e1964]
MDSLIRHPISRPMSVQDVTKRAQDYDFNIQIPLKYWLRSADTLLKEVATLFLVLHTCSIKLTLYQAYIYEQEGNDQQAYLLLYRHATLVLSKFPIHPDALLRENRAALSYANKGLPRILDRLEKLKPRISYQYENYQRYLADREARRAAQSSEVERYIRDRDSFYARERRISDPPANGPSRSLVAGENSGFAVQLAHTEIRRRQTARRASRQAGVTPAEQLERRTGGVWENWEDGLSGDSRIAEDNDMRSRMEIARRQIDRPVSYNPPSPRASYRRSYDPNQSSSSGKAYNYPSVPRRYQDAKDYTIPPPDPPRMPRPQELGPPIRGILKEPKPLLPPKERFIYDFEGPQPTTYPPRPAKRPVTPPAAPASTTPSPDPHLFTFKPAAYLENGTPLRTIFLPPTLRLRFLEVAAPNTRANLETCGILCGTLISNALFISKLVIPDQESTSDTCDTINEAAMFDYCDSEDLMVFGWIHTHPSQTCFMSSRDLHTHCGYQVMMPEAIAIVCAPSTEPSWGVFRMTDPPGMKLVLNCQQTGLFHPHGEDNIYTDALRPGHVFEAAGLEFEVVDLRPKR